MPPEMQPDPTASTDTPEASPAARRTSVPVGEAWVWMTSMGITIGLAMVCFLLGLIVYNGLKVFWPKPVTLLTLNEGSTAGIGDSPAFAGEIVKRQEKRVANLDADGNPLPPQREIQLFVGNKDAYGFSYKFIDLDEIAETTTPENLIVAERLEYGNAIFTPVSLALADGTAVPSDNPGFDATFSRLVEEGNARREEIRHIERDQIGDINSRMEKLRLAERALDKDGETGAGVEEKRARIAAETATLQTDYEALAAKAGELRALQKANTITYLTPDGQTVTLGLGEIIHYYFPNQLGFFDKLGHFFHRLWGFLSEEPREANTEGGIFPAIFGTFVMTLLMSLAVAPFGIIAAIYLREYAKQGLFVRSVRIAVNNLAGVPSIVFGVFGLGFFVYLCGGSIDRLFFDLSLPTPTFGTGGILWASLTLALMTVPVVIVATEEALASVSRGSREAALACGASKWQTIQRIVLPASRPGILTGLILAMARGAGEVAPLMLVGVVKLAPTLPIDGSWPFVHLERKFMHLGFHIYDLGFQSPDSEAAKPMVFATTFLLIVLVVVMNLTAILIRNRLRKKYALASF